ncbi:MAG: hypothetical protein FWG51_05680 [Firmicutes bacterium]|nr:hypothetical protein [Bacillota bacterium]
MLTLFILAGGLIFLQKGVPVKEEKIDDSLSYAEFRKVWAQQANYDGIDDDFYDEFGRGLVYEEPDEQYLYKPSSGLSSYNLSTDISAAADAVDISTTKIPEARLRCHIFFQRQIRR